MTHIRNSAGNDNSNNTVDRFWQVDKTGTSCVATLQFNYSTDEEAASGNTGMIAQRWNSLIEGWDPPLPGQSSAGSNSVQVPLVTSFGAWAVASGGSPLPIKLLHYDAKAMQNIVRNSWTTASEEDNDFFTVERSLDGLHFEKAGIVDGAGTSVVQKKYLFDDMDPFNGVSYYRLKQTDFNGDYSYSELIAVRMSSEKASKLEIYPNPSSDVINLISNDEFDFRKSETARAA